MKKLMQKMGVAVLALLALGSPALAEDLIMARMNAPFPEAMTLLQSAISSRGYTITRLQQVNENLARREFKSDMYRVVYFGKLDEVRQVTAAHPELIPFLPLNITIFAEGEQAILVASHPQALQQFFPDPALKPVLERWEKDMDEIMDELREGADS
ncbi:DUF302 domain-containing protein [Thiobacillus thioparus]|jgi:uncharacterized protein (DUF302 family)|uniref:DUF302 domain-containing protein n=1 Tax=Thiobacillus thioparus TaxID=931 RepID=UPI00037F219C|nr:DUF302 domain-containing protein [Thiobacillus thioparus]